MDMAESNPDSVIKYLIEQLNNRGTGYMNVKEGESDSPMNNINDVKDPFKDKFKKTFKGTWVSNYGYNLESANENISKGLIDMACFGQPYLFNSDLVEKFTNGTPLNHMGNIKDTSKIFQYYLGPGPEGYTDLSVFEP